MPLGNLFVSKDRFLTFAATVTIHELRNVPFLSGFYYVKHRLRKGSQARQSVSNRAPLQDHTATFNWSSTFDVELTKDAEGTLNACPLRVIVKKEAGYGEGTERVGMVDINLSEYCGMQKPVTRKLLLQETRTNTTIRLTVEMNQTRGDNAFRAPSNSTPIEIFGSSKGLWNRPGASSVSSQGIHGHSTAASIVSGPQPGASSVVSGGPRRGAQERTGSTCSSRHDVQGSLSHKSSLSDFRMGSQGSEMERLNGRSLKSSHSYTNLKSSSGHLPAQALGISSSSSKPTASSNSGVYRTGSTSSVSSGAGPSPIRAPFIGADTLESDEGPRSLHSSFTSSLASTFPKSQASPIILPKPPLMSYAPHQDLLTPSEVVDEIFSRARFKASAAMVPINRVEPFPSVDLTAPSTSVVSNGHHRSHR